MISSPLESLPNPFTYLFCPGGQLVGLDGLWRQVVVPGVKVWP
jgi:hypothetical protein